MCESALGLIKDYLWRRFIRVVNQGKSSAEKEIFSSVPQGGKWSPKFWNFDISEIESALCELACLFCYADDSGLWYEVTHQNRNTIIDTINKDLEKLMAWGVDNKTTFEPKKNTYMFISQRKARLDCSGLMMGGKQIKAVEEMELVGFVFDKRLRWGPMIDKVVKKARIRMAGLRRLRTALDDKNMKTMYLMFI
jgi:hypothetical protein